MAVISYDEYRKKNKKRLHEEHQAWVEQNKPLFDAKFEQDKKRQNETFGQVWLGAMGGFFGKVGEGMLGVYEGVSDKVRYTTANVLDAFGADNKAEQLRENAKRNDTQDIISSFKHIVQGDLAGKRSEEEVELRDFVNTYGQLDTNKFGKTIQNVGSGLGSTLGFASMSSYLGGTSAGIGSKIIKGAVDMAPIYLSASGSGTSEAYSQGATDKEATKYGVLSGLIEAGTESLFGALGGTADALGLSNTLGLGKGALDDKVIGAFTKRFKSTLMKNLVDLGIRSAGEGVEEVLSDFFGAFAKKMTYSKEEELKKLLQEPEYLDDFISGTLSSMLSQAPGNIISIAKGTEVGTGITKNENKVVDAIVQERINQEIDRQNANNEEKIGKLTNKEELAIRNEVREDLQNGFINTDMIEKTLGKGYDVSNDSYLQEAYNEKTRRGTNFQVNLDSYKNEAQRNIVQKAVESGILNDSKKTHNFVDLVSKLAADKGMDFDFTNNAKLKESGFSVEGRTINGMVDGNTIRLNIESNNALNKTVGHEITHVLEGSNLYQTLQDSLKNYVGESQWNTRIKELTETYKNVENAEVEKELTADLVGENLFNNEDFIRSLSTKDRNLFEKIYDEIKYLAKIATAGSKEKRDLVKLQKVFQDVYRDSKTNVEGSKYSVDGKEQISLSYAKQRFKNNINKYGYNTAFEDAILYHNLQSDEIDSLYEYAKKQPEYQDKREKDSLDRKYKEYKEGNQFKYSLTTDNQGRQLSEQQQEYFKDSKVRDENGNLKVMYHGTPRGTTTEFRPGTYFTENQKYADRYQNLGASSISTKSVVDNPRTYEVYLDIKNPFDTKNNPVAREIFENEFLGKWGNGTPLSDRGYPDWVEGIDLQEFLETEHPEFDGFIVDEGGEGGYGQPVVDRGLSYITMSPQQVKNVDNTNPTSNPDIRYQLGTNEVAPTSGYDVRGEDIRLQNTVQETIAPLQQQVQELQNTIEDLRDNIAPITEEEATNLPIDENIQPPTRYNLTQEESQRLDYLDRLERENMLPDSLVEERDNLRARESQEDNLEMTQTESLSEIRDYDEVGKRNVNAYQYDHPEVKPFFQEEAQKMLNDLKNSTKGERFITGDTMDNPNNWQWTGIERNTSEDIARLLDGTDGYKYSYDEIEKGLNAIIEDHGNENIAVAKRIEFILDERLRNGYDVFNVMDENYEPYHVEPNQEYLNMLAEQTWDNYYDEIPWNQVAPEVMTEPVIRMTQEQIAPTRETTQERDIMEMVDNEGNRKSTTYNQPRQIKQERSALRRFRDTIEGAFINRNVHQDNLARETGNQRIKYKADMLSNVMGEVNYDINNAQTNNQGQEIGKGINDLFAEANSQGLGEVFNDYLINYSNIDRYAQGKGSQTPLEVSQRLVRDYIKQYPQLRAWAEEVWQWSKNERQNLVDAGLIDQELANYLEQIYPHYVPYVSDYENVDQYFEGVGELKPRGIKRAKGNAGKLLSVQDAMARYTYAQKNAVRTNELYSEIVDTLGRVPNFGIDERTDFTNMKDTLYKDSRGQYLTAYRDGKQITTQINAELYNELNKNFENQVKNFEKNMELVLKPIQKINEVRRNILTTWSPTFPITNAIKDIQDALLNSKHTKDMVKNYPSALKELATMNTDQVKQFVALYGSGFTMGEFGQDTMNQKTKNVKFLRKLSKVNEIIELAPRYAEFKASLQKGESLQQAMYNAREITTNFGRGGVITKALNRNGATFLNASVQGFDKLIRNFSGENGAKGVVSSLIKATAFGIVPALFNHLVFGGDDDEEYEALPDYIKDNYYLIKLDDEGDFLRIPKGRMLSVFGSAARRTLEATEGRENAFKGWLENAWNQTGVNNPADNNLFAPLMQAYGSKNGTAWYGGDIVPTRLQDKPKAEQYDESTDKFSIWLGNKLGISPYKLNYVIDQYTGGIGDIILPTITEEATSDGNILAPIKDKFVVNSTTKSKYVSDFYSKRGEMNVKANGSNATDEDKLMSKYLDDISWEMSALYKEKRAIQSDTTLSKKEKFEKAQEIKKEINRLAKVGLDGYKNVVAEDNFAVANDDRGYYKNTKGEWKAIPQNDIETVDGNGLTDFEASNYFKTKNDIYNINEKYSGSKDYEGRRKAIVNAIRSANIPDKAKIELYTRSYKDDMATKYVDAGLSADAYLEFKSQTFTADKDKNGKSISGSKKQKVFDYINSMNIPFEQKVMLAKKEYNTYNEYNPQIINYLNNNPNLEYNDIKEILEDLGFKVDSNGNISW